MFRIFFLILYFITNVLISEENFFDVIKTKNLNKIKLSLQNGSNINQRNDFNTTPLIYATELQNIELVNFLLENGANPNFFNYRNETPLVIAFKKNNFTIAESLLKFKANPNYEDIDGNSILQMEFPYLDKYKFFELLLKYNANINHRNSLGETISFKYKKDLEVLEYLVSKKLNLNLQNLDGNSILFQAIEEQDLELVKFILDKKVNLNIQNFSGDTALMTAVYFDNLEILDLILQLKPDLDIGDIEGMTVLMHSIEKKNFIFVKKILEQKPNLEKKDNKGYTAFLYSVLNNDEKIIELIINSKPNFKINSYNDYNALMLAAYKGNLDLINFLIEQGLDVEFSTKKNETAIYHSIRNYKERQFDALNLISKYKKNKKKDLGLLASINFNDQKSLEYFIEFNYDLNIKNNDGNTALMLIAKFGHVHLLNLIIDKVNLNEKNKLGETAYDISIKEKNYQITKLLNPKFNPPKIIKPSPKDIQTKSFPLLIIEKENHELEDFIKSDDVISLKELYSKNRFKINSLYSEKTLSPLMYTIYYGSYKCFQFIFSLNPNLNLLDKKGNHALFQILEFAKLEANHKILPEHYFFYKFLNSKIDLNHKNKFGNSFFHEASLLGLDNIFLITDNQKINWNLKNDKFQTNFLLACKQKNDFLIDFFIKKQADLNTLDSEENSCLNYLAESTENPYSSFQKLIQAGIKIDTESISGKKLVQSIYKNGHRKLLKLLKSNFEKKTFPKIIIEETDKDKEVNFRDSNLNTKLMIAIKNSNFQQIKKIINEKENLDFYDSNQDTPLHITVLQSNFEITKLLLEHKANPNYKNKEGYTPLMTACFNGDFEIVKLLIEYDANISIKSNQNDIALMIAARYGHKKILNFLLKNNSHPNSINKYFGTSLIASAKANEFKISKILLDSGANPNLKFSDGNIPLFYAVQNGNIRLTKLLIDHKSKITHKNIFGENTLDILLKNYQFRKFKFLLNENILLKDELIYELILKKEYEFLMLYLEKIRTDKESFKENYFYNPISYAICLNDEIAFKILSDFGFPKNRKNELNFSPKDYAKDFNYKNFLKYYED